ncbi:MAG: hypothetical protein VST65_06285 [Nitrospirota bacterium]|nr:hypothetical protein [Nitrospirota bacterium]
MTLKRAEHCLDRQRVHVPVILVFQSVFFSSNRQEVVPPFEMVDMGWFVPGICATAHPPGNGTSQLCWASPLAMPKLQNFSVVAVELPMGWAADTSTHAKFRIAANAAASRLAVVRESIRMLMEAPPALIVPHSAVRIVQEFGRAADGGKPCGMAGSATAEEIRG